MTPKEKAKELVEKFMSPIDELHKYPMCFDTAKQCALIALDEILSISYFTHNPTEDDELYRNYFLQVKQEIENL